MHTADWRIGFSSPSHPNVPIRLARFLRIPENRADQADAFSTDAFSTKIAQIRRRIFDEGLRVRIKYASVHISLQNG